MVFHDIMNYQNLVSVLNNYSTAKQINTKVENQKDHKNEPIILR